MLQRDDCYCLVRSVQQVGAGVRVAKHVCFEYIFCNFDTNRLPWYGVKQWTYETWTWHYIGTFVGLREVGHALCIALTLTVLRYVVNMVILEVRQTRTA